MPRFPLQTAAALAAAVLLFAGARKVRPELRLPDRSLWTGLIEYSPERTPLSPSVPLPAKEAVPAQGRSAAPVRFLEDSNAALDRFYASLWRTERKEAGAVTRIVHYGDSPTTGDLITGDVRELLQQQYGDAGLGFTLIAKPWAWYQRRYVEVSGSGWSIDPALHFGSRDGVFGFAGVRFAANGSGRSRIRVGRRVETIELWFERRPAGGKVVISAEGRAAGEVGTAGEAGEPGYALVRLPPGSGEIDLEAGGGPVVLYGAALEGAGPGLVYDCLGLNGGSITVLASVVSAAHLAEQLRHRKPHLVVLNYGTNEASFSAYIDRQYEKELREAVRRVRGALPDASVLIMSPMDRGERSGGAIRTLPTIPRLVAIQRRVAAETGCGFFNTYAAMGGEGTMARWYEGQPRLVSADFIHPTPRGGRLIADVIVREIRVGLNRYKLRTLASARP